MKSYAANLYDMYVANDMEVGFWVKRRNWGDLCARITFVGELERGIPCYGHPVVRADLYLFSSGELKSADAELLAAGAYKSWQQIPPPPLHVWSHARKRVPVAALRRPDWRIAPTNSAAGLKAA